jgi:hypothetical protein
MTSSLRLDRSRYNFRALIPNALFERFWVFGCDFDCDYRLEAEICSALHLSAVFFANVASSVRFPDEWP